MCTCESTRENCRKVENFFWKISLQTKRKKEEKKKMMINITYYWYDYWQQNGHPYSMNYWISMNGPTRITIIIVGYLYFCLSLGPILMMNRKPFVLRKIMFIYNIMTIILNLYFFIQSLYYLDYGRRLFDFKFPDHTIITDVDVEQISLTHFYLWTKLLDLFDTIFFVLRKKNNQISGKFSFQIFFSFFETNGKKNLFPIKIPKFSIPVPKCTDAHTHTCFKHNF